MIRSVAVAALVLAACAPSAAPHASPPTPFETAAAPAAQTGTPTPAPLASAPTAGPTTSPAPSSPYAVPMPDVPVTRDDPFHLRPTTDIPAEFALITTDAYEVRGTRVWLADLTGAKLPHDLLTYTAYSGGAAISRDGRTVVVSGGDKWGQTLFVGDVRTGAIRIVDRGDVGRRPSYPAISPDGSRIAYAISADRWITQIWGGRLPDGPFVPLVVAHPGESIGYGMAFSADARFLSYLLNGRGRVLDLVSGRVYDVGEADAFSMRWHPARSLLAIGSPWVPDGGFSIATFDPVRAAFADVVRSSTGHGGILAWSPIADAVYSWESDECDPRAGCAKGQLVERALDGHARVISDRRLGGPVYVRRDGVLLNLAWQDGEPLVPLVVYPTGTAVVRFCKRGGVAPACGGNS